MHITITGNLGSGKSTICKLLGEKYQFEIYSTGKVQRELARQMNMTTLELNQLMRSDKKYDKMIDDETSRISRDNREKDIIFDSRLAWHFVESSFKVFISVSLDVAAMRVMNDTRGVEEKYTSFEEAKRLLAERAATERLRYKEIYDLNYMDVSNYDLVIDSTYCLPDRIAEVILAEAREYERRQTRSARILVSPKRIAVVGMQEEDKDRLQGLIETYKKTPYTIDKVIRVRKFEDDYEALEAFDDIKAAIYAEVCYIPIEVVSQ